MRFYVSWPILSQQIGRGLLLTSDVGFLNNNAPFLKRAGWWRYDILCMLRSNVIYSIFLKALYVKNESSMTYKSLYTRNCLQHYTKKNHWMTKGCNSKAEKNFHIYISSCTTLHRRVNHFHQYEFFFIEQCRKTFVHPPAIFGSSD